MENYYKLIFRTASLRMVKIDRYISKGLRKLIDLDISVGIVNRYGLERPGIESW